MGPRNILNLRLHRSDDSGAQLEAAEPPSRRPRKRRERSYNFGRIPKLLMLGYASEDSQRRYEKQRDWKRLYTILMFKIENISIVSGLLLASSCNLLIAGDLRRMTHAAVSASMFGSILSIVFGLLCRINITAGRLEFLVTRTRLFYYLYATPSLWGGGAALVFFVAVCAYTWLEESTAQYGWGAKASAVVLSGMLIANAVACFVLGAGVIELQAEGVDEKLEEEEEEKERQEEEEEEEEEEERGEERQDAEKRFVDEAGLGELEQRNQRARAESSMEVPGFSSFGISAWATERQSSSDGESQSSSAPRRATTFDLAASSGPRPLPPQRAHVRRQSKW